MRLNAPPGRFRRVTIQCVNRRGQLETIRLLSSLVDPNINARVIGAIYRKRWQIELFFKWLKTWARMDHLLSTSRVSVYALAALGRLASGQCTLDEAMAVIARRERERELNRARGATPPHAPSASSCQHRTRKSQSHKRHFDLRLVSIRRPDARNDLRFCGR